MRFQIGATIRNGKRLIHHVRSEDFDFDAGPWTMADNIVNMLGLKPGLVYEKKTIHPSHFSTWYRCQRCGELVSIAESRLGRGLIVYSGHAIGGYCENCIPQ